MIKNKNRAIVRLLGLLVWTACSGFADQAVLEASGDSWVNGNTTDTNYGTDTRGVIRYQNTTWGHNYSLYKFDFSTLPSNIEVTSVRMRFYTSLGNWPGPTNFAPVAIFNNTQDWSETNVTFNTVPTYDVTATETLDYLGANWNPVYFTGTNMINASGWLEFQGEGTMALVQGWADGTIDNFGISMMGTGDYVSDSRTFQPQTKEHTSPALWPEIIVDYTLIAFRGYAGWADGWGGVDIGTETNDFDGDGLLNIAEYALGGDPTNELDQGTASTFGIAEEGGTNWFGYIYPQVADPDSGLAYSLETCTNLVVGTWTNNGYAVMGTNVTGGTLDFVTNSTDTVDPEKFIRLAIVHEPSFNVMDFGAQGDGNADDTAAILSAIAAADASTSPATVFFPAGSYRISSVNDYALQLDNLSDICLKGEGTNTVLLVSDPENGGVGVENSTNVLLADFTVDYDPVPFTQGTIVAVDTATGTFDLQIDLDYLELDHPCFAAAPQKWGVKVDLDREAYDIWAYFSSAWSNLGSRVWRMTADDPAFLQQHPLSVGDRYVHKARRYEAYGVGSSFCEGIELQNVTVHASAALATGWVNSSGVVIQGLGVFVKPGSGRLIASNGDGIHAPGCSDGLVITDCFFEGLTDDAINIHGRGGVVISNVSDTVKQVGLPRVPAVFAVGDELQIYHHGGGFTNATVLSVSQISNTVVEIGFDRALPNLAFGSEGDKISNLSRCGQGSLIANNFFGTQRGRGVLLRSHDVTVRDNVFRNPSLVAQAIDLRHEDWYYAEGPAAYNVTIQGNHIEGGTNQWSWSSPWIYIHSWVGEKGVDATSYDSFNVLIESNTFVNIDGPAVEARSARDVRIINNTVHIDSGFKAVSSPIIELSTADEIQIVDLDIYDLNPSTYAAVHIMDTVGAVSITNLTTELSAGSVEVQDDR